MWNGDLNRPSAKAMRQMIMGMTDVQVKEQSTSITGTCRNLLATGSD